MGGGWAAPDMRTVVMPPGACRDAAHRVAAAGAAPASFLGLQQRWSLGGAVSLGCGNSAQRTRSTSRTPAPRQGRLPQQRIAAGGGQRQPRRRGRRQPRRRGRRQLWLRPWATERRRQRSRRRQLPAVPRPRAPHMHLHSGCHNPTTNAPVRSPARSWRVWGRAPCRHRHQHAPAAPPRQQRTCRTRSAPRGACCRGTGRGSCRSNRTRSPGLQQSVQGTPGGGGGGGVKTTHGGGGHGVACVRAGGQRTRARHAQAVVLQPARCPLRVCGWCGRLRHSLALGRSQPHLRLPEESLRVSARDA